jgi:hypothetical protein
MGRYVLIVVALYSSLGFSSLSTLNRQFAIGAYLGEGNYFTSTGQKGAYSSYADVGAYEWTAAYVKEGKLARYNARFDFSGYGFFNVDVTQYGSNGKKSYHDGHGHCYGNTCHLSVGLEHGHLYEAVAFIRDENRIERSGSLRYVDEKGDSQTIAWRENLLLLEND